MTETEKEKVSTRLSHGLKWQMKQAAQEKRIDLEEAYEQAVVAWLTKKHAPTVLDGLSSAEQKLAKDLIRIIRSGDDKVRAALALQVEIIDRGMG